MGRVNPIDLTANGVGETYYSVIETLLRDSWVGLIIAVHVPPSFIDPIDVAKSIKDVVEDYNYDKPVIPLFLGPERENCYSIFNNDPRLPTPLSHRSTALSVKALIHRKRFLEKKRDR
jgi:acyl-CoA synthetase (NDP forming)